MPSSAKYEYVPNSSVVMGWVIAVEPSVVRAASVPSCL
jgi:hypothetical protein